MCANEHCYWDLGSIAQNKAWWLFASVNFHVLVGSIVVVFEATTLNQLAIMLDGLHGCPSRKVRRDVIDSTICVLSGYPTDRVNRQFAQGPTSEHTYGMGHGRQTPPFEGTIRPHVRQGRAHTKICQHIKELRGLVLHVGDGGERDKEIHTRLHEVFCGWIRQCDKYLRGSLRVANESEALLVRCGDDVIYVCRNILATQVSKGKVPKLLAQGGL
mmetsp:Transcript_19030/g.34403  ORF Transcript_19030/g.34403 Transcript_19030/m.34403 type:complete len:215 (-) Transcript_19030:413-1057(-)